MVKAMLVLADGFEESEALITTSYLRRAGIDLELVTINSDTRVTSSHDVRIDADRTWDQIDPDTYDLLVTPGGIPGATNLAADKRLTDTVAAFYDQGKWLAHICASPVVLRAAGIASRISGVCFPGFEDQVGFGQAGDQIVQVDGHVITSRGPLTTPFFALTIIKHVLNEDAAADVAKQVLLPQVHRALTTSDTYTFAQCNERHD